MSIEIITGTTGLSGLFNALNDAGAFIKMEEAEDSSDGSIRLTGYVSEECFLQGGYAEEGTTYLRWLDSKHLSQGLTQPIWASSTSANSNNQNWKIVKTDTGFLFGISSASGTSGPVYLRHFIGKTVDENGVGSMGIVSPTSTTPATLTIMTDGNPGTIEMQSVSCTSSKANTKLSQISAKNTLEKFVDLYLIHYSPYSSERRFVIGSDYFQSNYEATVAIRFGGA